MLDTSELFDALGGERSPEGEKNIIDRLRFDDSLNIPIELTDADLWTNYINEDLYFMDKKVREFLQKTRYQREKKGGYRTTCSLVFAWIYGRQPEPSDSSVCRMLHEVLKYYCTSYTGQTTYMGKKVSRVYEFSKYSGTNKRPYSLKLRLEEGQDVKNAMRNGSGHNKEKRRHGRRKHSEAG